MYSLCPRPWELRGQGRGTVTLADMDKTIGAMGKGESSFSGRVHFIRFWLYYVFLLLCIRVHMTKDVNKKTMNSPLLEEYIQFILEEFKKIRV